MRGKHRAVPRCRVDNIILIIWGWSVLATIIADGSFSPQVTRMMGNGFDTVLIYFVVRFHVISADDLKGCGRWLIVVAVIMGILGVLEATTKYSPYSGLRGFRSWVGLLSTNQDEIRLGLLRAHGSTSVHIYFGLSMMLVTGMLWSINKGFSLRGGRWGILLGVLGTLSSMSSGPWMACAVMFVLGLYRNKPTSIRLSIYLIVLFGIFLELASNRHFYNLVDYLVLDSSNAWYRSRLLEIAASRVSEYWLVGVGSNWPIHWGLLLDFRESIDVVNHFLIVALNGGLLALFLYVTSHYLAISYVTTFRKSSGGMPLHTVAFSLACVLLALDFATMTVGLFGPPLILSCVLLAMIVAVTQMRQMPHLPDSRGAIAPTD